MEQIPAFLNEENEVYFAALNTSCGFISHFAQIFSPESLHTLIVLKGGPGTGKSTMLRSFALCAKEAGEKVRYYLCSSDPKSLDAVLLPNRRIAVLDGTAPHSVEALCPGAVEELFDAGAFWDIKILKENKALFFSLIRQKKEHYRRAYELLQSAGNLVREIQALTVPALLEEKMEAAARRQYERLLLKEKRGRGTLSQVTAFSGVGKVELRSLIRRAETVVCITEADGVGLMYLRAIRALADEREVAYEYSRALLAPSYADVLFFPESKTLFCVGTEWETATSCRVNMQRFLDAKLLSEHRNRLRFLKRTVKALLSESVNSFAAAGGLHAELEAHYQKAMDFYAMDQAWQKKIELLLSTT